MQPRSLLVTALSVLITLMSAGLPILPVSARSVGADSAFVEVPIYVQQRNLSCEYASLVIAMGSYDTWVSEWTFDELVPASDNPHWGYRGDINGAWGNTTDYGVYPEPLVGPLAELGFRGEVFYARGDASSLQRYLANGVPVILWLGMWGDQSYYEYASDGTPYKINPGYHVVVGYGYDESGVYARRSGHGEHRLLVMGRLHVDVGRHGWHVAGGLAAGAGGHSVDRFLIRPDGKRPRAWRLLLTHPHPRRLTRQHRSAREHGLIGVLALAVTGVDAIPRKRIVARGADERLLAV